MRSVRAWRSVWGAVEMVQHQWKWGRESIGSRYHGRWFTLISKPLSITLAQRCASSGEAANTHYQLPECQRGDKLHYAFICTLGCQIQFHESHFTFCYVHTCAQQEPGLGCIFLLGNRLSITHTDTRVLRKRCIL